MVTAWLDDTDTVLTLNVADVEPAETVTVAGTVEVLELEERATTAPPDGAAAERLTVPVTGLPPVTELEESVRLKIRGVPGLGVGPK